MISTTDASTAGSVADALRAKIRGDVLDDPVRLGLYATDASMYQMSPVVVVLPRDRADVLRTIRIGAEHGVPIVPRGAGTSLTGQSIGRSIVLDVSRHMRKLLEVNVEGRWARVEPGLVCDELNKLLGPHGLHYAPDPATSSRATLGAIIACNSAGMRSIRYGMAIDHLLGLDLALSTGDVLNLGEIDEQGYAAKESLRDREGEIYRGFREIIEANREEIADRYPKVKRHSGGYPFNRYVNGWPWNMAQIVSSSEGTLGVILEARVRLEPVPAVSGLCLAHFAEIGECLRAVAPAVRHAPSAVELIDGLIIRLARDNLLTRETCRVIEGEPGGILVIEAQGETETEVRATLESIAADLTGHGMGYALPIIMEPRSMAAVWAMRENALGLMTTVKGPRKPVPFVEDAAVPLESLPQYCEEVIAVCERHDRPVSLFGHASVGLLHIRPMHDLHDPLELDLMKRIQGEVFEIVLRHEGGWSGEHGDGIVRAGYNRRFFGDSIYEGFRRLKSLFDPAGLMNPGKIVDSPPMDRDLRYSAPYEFRKLETMYRYDDPEGFREAVERCTGVGACRQTLAGTMCPSYIATRDEEHSTRGRANALRLAMTGRLGPDSVSLQHLHEVFDLCLSCKGCKNECPNNVDIGRLKAEVTHEYHLHHGATVRERVVASPALLGALASGWRAPIANAMLSLRAVRAVLELTLGFDRRRPLPRYATQRMSTWFRRHRRKRHPAASADAAASGNARPRRVVLFNDTYMEYHEPSVGHAAVEVLEAAGYDVELVRAGDSQRPAISKGLLRLAKRRGEAVLRRLAPHARAGTPILVCEPSCASSLTDDLPDLVEDVELGATVAKQVRMIDTFLAEEMAADHCNLPWRDDGDQVEILFHGHCHQKALEGVNGTKAALEAIPGATVRDSEAGCCGMAGAFGYEKEHYDISVKVAEDRLLPALRDAAPGTRIVANGFSCRHQIRDLSDRRAVHAIEMIRDHVRVDGSSGR